MNIISIILRAIGGLIALFYGRRIFFLFLGIVGFLVGFFLAQLIVPDAGALVFILVGLVLGVLGAILSKAAPYAVIAVVGFFAGGYALMAVGDMIATLPGFVKFILFVIGGAAGVFLAVKSFDWALVILSSISGAATLASIASELIKFGGTIQTILFIVLAVVGIAFQIRAVKPASKPGK